MRHTFALLLCAWATSLQATIPGPVVFSELMWMGSNASNADEWIELYNRGETEIDLAGWTITRLTQDGEQVMLQLEQGKLPPGAVFLIANYGPANARSQLAVEPHRVHAAVSLPNNKLQLRLYDGHPDQGGRLMDVADDGTGGPLAGDAGLKRAMVRIAFQQEGSLSTSWATAQEASGWDEGATELGTPGRIPDYLRPVSPDQQGNTYVEPVPWAALKDL